MDTMQPLMIPVVVTLSEIRLASLHAKKALFDKLLEFRVIGKKDIAIDAIVQPLNSSDIYELIAVVR